MELDLWMWGAFGAFVITMLLLDLFAFGRSREEISFKRAVVWSVAWTLLGLGFAAFLYIW